MAGLPSAEAAEREAGIRCRGCNRRITTGWRWTIVGVASDQAHELQRVVTVKTTCAGDLDPDTAERIRAKMGVTAPPAKCPAYLALATHGAGGRAVAARERIELEWLPLP
jgi:hypothetical protein